MQLPLMLLVMTMPAAEAGDPVRVPALNPQTAHLACVAGDWTAWTTSELIEATRMNRAQSFITRYYRQKIGADTAELAFRMSGTYGRGVVTILADGTLLLGYGTGLLWAAPGKPPSQTEQLTLDGEVAEIVAGWPDGVVIQHYRLNQNAPLYFVPIAKGALDFAAKVRMTDETGVSVNSSQSRPRRFGDRLAWAGAAGIHVFDLKERILKVVPGTKPDTACELLAFDGAFAVTVFDAFDLAAGRRVPYDRPMQAHIVALRNGIVYWTDDDRNQGRLCVTGLGPAKPRTVEVLAFPSYLPYDGRHYHAPAPIVTDKGLRIWTGKEWREIEWLKELPAEK